MSKIYTFRAKSITLGTVSIEAVNIQEARELSRKLLAADTIAINMEQGAGEVRLSDMGHEDTNPDDGTHYFTTPRANAAENAELIDEANLEQ